MAANLDFLQLVQRAYQECGVGEQTDITTLVGATGEVLRFKDWVNQSWVDLQNMRSDWGWMRQSALLGTGWSFVPSAGQKVINAGTGAGQVGIDPTTFGKWDLGSFRSYTTSVGTNDEVFMSEVSFDRWRDSYMYGAMQSVQTRPQVVAAQPDEQGLVIGPSSDGNYTLTADYWLSASEMSADADTPTGLPKQFELMPVYGAMMKYGAYDVAPEVYDRGQANWKRGLRALTLIRAPIIELPGAMA